MAEEKENKREGEEKMPDACCIITAEDRREKTELHRPVDRYSGHNRPDAEECNRGVSEFLQRVIFFDRRMFLSEFSGNTGSSAKRPAHLPF